MSITVPSENAIERDAAAAPPPEEVLPDEPEAEPDTQRSEVSGLVLVPGFRFDGSTITPSWNQPEGEIFDWLTTVDVEIVDGAVYSGRDGIFWARGLKPDGEQQSLIVKFVNLGKETALESWGTEFHFESENNLASREVAAYELLKAIGGEDIGLPLCIRDLDPSSLISDTVRGVLARTLKISPLAADQKIGPTAVVQYVPLDMDNFAEQWASLGETDKERWERSTDQLRYSIYRAYFADFILGTPCRSYTSFGYNRNTDKLLMTDLSVSFAHAGFTTEKYSQMRLKGWGRSSGGAARFVDNMPPSAYDFHNIFNELDEKYLEEAVVTAKQIADRMKDELAERLGLTLLENDVPMECVASVFLRLAYLSFSPGSVIKRPIEFIRNLCLPIRSNMVASDPRITTAVEYVNDIMTVVMGEHFDVVEVLTQPLPGLVDLLL